MTNQLIIYDIYSEQRGREDQKIVLVFYLVEHKLLSASMYEGLEDSCGIVFGRRLGNQVTIQMVNGVNMAHDKEINNKFLLH